VFHSAPEVAARARDESVKSVLAAEDDQAAMLHVAEKRASDTGHASKKSVALEKIKLRAKLEQCCLAIADLEVNLESEMKAVLTFVGSLNSGAGAVDTTVTETRNELTLLKTASDLHLQSQKSRFAHHVQSLQSGEHDTIQHLDVLRADVLLDHKLTSNGDTKIFKQKLATFKRCLVKTSKDKNLGAQAPSELDSAPPLHSILVQLIAMPDMDVAKFSASVFEAKGGVRACAIGAYPLKDPVPLIKANAYSKKAFRDITTHLKENEWGVINMSEPPKRKKIVSFLKAAYDATLFNRLPVPHNEDWPTVLYEPQFFGMAKSFTYVGMSPFAAMEARLMLEGTQIVAGIAYDKCPGETMKDKRNNMYKLHIDELKPLIVNFGFITSCDSSKLIVLPTGFMIMIAAATAGWGVRWGMSSDEHDTGRVKMLLRLMLDAFPELKHPSAHHSPFYDYLNAA
jgi:hypothetical protein